MITQHKNRRFYSIFLLLLWMICLAACSESTITTHQGGGSIIVGNTDNMPEFVISLQPINPDGSVDIDSQAQSDNITDITYDIFVNQQYVQGPIDLESVITDDLNFKHTIPSTAAVQEGDVIQIHFQRTSDDEALYQGIASQDEVTLFERVGVENYNEFDHAALRNEPSINQQREGNEPDNTTSFSPGIQRNPNDPFAQSNPDLQTLDRRLERGTIELFSGPRPGNNTQNGSVPFDSNETNDGTDSPPSSHTTLGR